MSFRASSAFVIHQDETVALRTIFLKILTNWMSLPEPSSSVRLMTISDIASQFWAFTFPRATFPVSSLLAVRTPPNLRKPLISCSGRAKLILNGDRLLLCGDYVIGSVPFLFHLISWGASKEDFGREQLALAALWWCRGRRF